MIGVVCPRQSTFPETPVLARDELWLVSGYATEADVSLLVMDDVLYYTAVVMKTERLLGGFETLLLLAVMRLDGAAYGVTVREELRAQAGKDVAVGAIYTGLARLEQRGLVESWAGDPTPERGGRAKRLYRATASGIRAIKDTQSAFRKLSSGLKLEKQIWST